MRRQRIETTAAAGAGKMLAVLNRFPMLLGNFFLGLGDMQDAFSNRQRRLYAVGDSRAGFLFHNQTIDHNLNRMPLATVDQRNLVDPISNSIHANANVAVGSNLFPELLISLVGIKRDRRQQQQPGAVGIFEQFINDVCLLYTSPSPRDQRGSRMPSSA